VAISSSAASIGANSTSSEVWARVGAGDFTATLPVPAVEAVVPSTLSASPVGCWTGASESGSSPRKGDSSRAGSHQPWLNRNDMMKTEIMTVGTMRQKPNSSILPSGTSSRPASANEATPGTIMTMPHSREMAMAVAMRGNPFLPIRLARLRANGALITSSTSRKIDWSAVAMVNDNAYGMRFGPKMRNKSSTSRWKAPVCCRIAPISTPKAMSRPTSAMISPKPPVMALMVSSTPRPTANPR
jgi:hypothetical protein